MKPEIEFAINGAEGVLGYLELMLDHMERGGDFDHVANSYELLRNNKMLLDSSIRQIREALEPDDMD